MLAPWLSGVNKHKMKNTPAVKFVQTQGKNTLCFVQSEDTFRTQPPSKWKKLLQRRRDTHCTKRDSCEEEFRTKRELLSEEEYLSPLPTGPLIWDSIPAPLYSVSPLSYLLMAPYKWLQPAWHKARWLWFSQTGSGCRRQWLQYFKMCGCPERPLSTGLITLSVEDGGTEATWCTGISLNMLPDRQAQTNAPRHKAKRRNGGK